MSATSPTSPTREQLIHALAEAAELEHCLMCTYLYAAFSMKTSTQEGLTDEQLAAVTRWRRAITAIAVEEMGHLVAVWNITAALGGAPRIGRFNFPLEPGLLPAGVVVRLAPFCHATLQHFVYLERPEDSDESDDSKFKPERNFTRATPAPRLTPTPLDYDTVGEFYHRLGEGLSALVAQHGEAETFCGDPSLQLTEAETGLKSARRVICLKTALGAFDSIIAQGEGARADSADSHYQKFLRIREEYDALLARDPNFEPAFPAATNPVLRRPARPDGKVWIEKPDAAAAVDLANATYGLMLRLLAYAFSISASNPNKVVATDLAIGLMRALTPLAERAARLPANDEHPGITGGVSFITLRDAAFLAPGASAIQFFRDRFAEIAAGARSLRGNGDERAVKASDMLDALAQRAQRDFDSSATVSTVSAPSPKVSPPAPTNAGDGIEEIEGKDLTLVYEGKRCIHSRFCVTGAPDVFLANVKGPWIHPDAMDVDALVEIAHACPSGAIRYRRKDNKPDESPPPVNVVRVREGGPYAFHAEIVRDGKPDGFRATLCRCGASKNKPFCDGSHHDVKFAATGEPSTGTATDALPKRDGALHIDPEPDGPLKIRGNLEVMSGTGRMVARIATARFCRCGGSANKPFCDGTHAKIGFKST